VAGHGGVLILVCHSPMQEADVKGKLEPLIEYLKNHPNFKRLVKLEIDSSEIWSNQMQI